MKSERASKRAVGDHPYRFRREAGPRAANNASNLKKKYPRWVQITLKAMDAMLAGRQRWLHYKTDICEYIDENWGELCDPRPRTGTWKQTVSAVLTTHPALFRSHDDKNGFWTREYNEDGTPVMPAPGQRCRRKKKSDTSSKRRSRKKASKRNATVPSTSSSTTITSTAQTETSSTTSSTTSSDSSGLDSNSPMDEVDSAILGSPLTVIEAASLCIPPPPPTLPSTFDLAALQPQNSTPLSFFAEKIQPKPTLLNMAMSFDYNCEETSDDMQAGSFGSFGSFVEPAAQPSSAERLSLFQSV